MNLELFILGGYGHFVWPAFIFTLASCSVLYLKTNKELQKQEKMFLSEYKETHTAKINLLKKRKLQKKFCLVAQFKLPKSLKNITCLPKK